MSRTALVVGAGWAGLTAALCLAERGVRVRLVERRAVLGGRALSFRSREAGHLVDNGQHLLMGCYERTFATLRRLGAEDRLDVQPTLRVTFLDPARGPADFACASAPSPFHLTLGVMRYAHLTSAERLKLLYGALLFTLRHRRSRATVAEGLEALGQGGAPRRCFWDPLAIAVLNELPERASAELLSEVLRRVFFAPAAASRLAFPRTGLSEVLPVPAARALEKLGVEIDLGSSVRELRLEAGRVAGVLLHDGRTVGADVVVCAVPPPALSEILPEALRAAPPFAGLGELRPAPIVSVHLWFAAPLETPRMAGFLDGPIHWLFTPPMQPEHGRYVTLVTSGAHALVGEAPERITAVARGELERYWPAARGLALADSLVVKEPAATWAATPAEQPHRFGPKTPLGNLFIAGDWAATGLPASLESAVASGERAAAACARQGAAMRTILDK